MLPIRIQHLVHVNRRVFTFGPIIEGLPRGMEARFVIDSRHHYFHGDPFFAVFHRTRMRGGTPASRREAIETI
jgi:hypothetical protein